MSAAMGTDLAQALARAQAASRPAIAAFLTAGFPTRDAFPATLLAISRVADLIEVGVPFSDPMADGLTIQRASRAALAGGVNLEWILDSLRATASQLAAPVVLMSYLNPLLAFGLERLAERAALSRVRGFIVPDLPLEESEPLRGALQANGLGLIQLVSPLTSPERLKRIAEASHGFLYAVTRLGTTGGRAEIPPETSDYLDRVRALSPVPVLAGFGVRTAAQVRALAAHADGVIVGSALIEAVERGEDPARFLAELSGGPQ